MPGTRLSLIFPVSALLLTLAQVSSAGPLGSLGAGIDTPRPPEQLIDHRSPRGKSPAQAAREARSRHGGGRVLDVDEVSGGYRVKLLQKGDVRIVFVPR